MRSLCVWNLTDFEFQYLYWIISFQVEIVWIFEEAHLENEIDNNLGDKAIQVITQIS